jgi:hypothetical protein
MTAELCHWRLHRVVWNHRRRLKKDTDDGKVDQGIDKEARGASGKSKKDKGSTRDAE